MATIRGHQALFKLYEEGEQIVINTITRVSVAMASSFSRQMYVGNPITQGDQTIEGWDGSIDMQVENDRVHRFIDDLINRNLNGIGLRNYTFIIRESYDNGVIASYVYFDNQFKPSMDISGLQEKITQRLDFQSAYRKRV